MTITRLKDSVARLGFESDISDDVLMPALSRAQHTVFCDRPVTSVARLVHPSYGGRLVLKSLVHRSGGYEEYALDGKAFSMILSGRGQYALIYGQEREVYPFHSDMKPVRMHLRSGARIRFEGDYTYSVISLAVYDETRGENEDDIPLYSERSEISLKRMIPDFLALSEEARDGDGAEIRGATVRDGRLILPDGYSGEVTITYHRAPIKPSGTDPDEEIDIPPECEELLPLLVASYVWLEDSPDISQYYRSLYREGISALRRNLTRVGAGEYSTNGWA